VRGNPNVIVTQVFRRPVPPTRATYGRGGDEVAFTGELANTNVPLLDGHVPVHSAEPGADYPADDTTVQGQVANPIGANEVQTITSRTRPDIHHHSRDVGLSGPAQPFDHQPGRGSQALFNGAYGRVTVRPRTWP